jgi:glucan phosphorylase
MKAALNGVPHCSTHDGWWAEATKGGWTIGPEHEQSDHDDGLAFYTLLEKELLPQFEKGLDSKVIEAIERNAKTGKIGDGKIFVTSINSVVRIRTGETDEDAL